MNSVCVDHLSLLIDKIFTNIKTSTIVSEDYAYNIKDLEYQVNREVTRLIEIGVSVEDIIVVYGEVSFSSIAMVLACLKYGCTVAPIDIVTPDSRLGEYLLEIQPKVILNASSSCLNSKYQECFGPSKYFKRRESEVPKALNRRAYLFPTSGSTGKPKIVVGKRDGLANFLSWQADYSTRFNCKSSGVMTKLNFDVVLRDILTPLILGLDINIAPKTILNSKTFFDWIKQRDIDFLHLVPTIASFILDTKTGHQTYDNNILVFFAGEPLTNFLLKRWVSVFPNTQIINLYGPTEATLASFFHHVESSNLDKYSTGVPVGRAIPNKKALITLPNETNDYREVVIGNETINCGEVVIEGDDISFGYLNHKSSNNGYSDDGVSYATGDLGFIDNNGELHLVGRKDNQIKINGIRVQLEDIQAQIEKIHNIQSCAVTYKSDSPYGNGLFLLVVTTDQRISEEYIRNECLDLLGVSLIPSNIKSVKYIPKTTNGKIDKEALISLFRPESTTHDKFNNIEKTVANCFTEVLNTSRIGLDSDFFQLGGDSLNSVSLICKLNDQGLFGVSEADIRKYSTVRKIAENAVLEVDTLKKLKSNFKEIWFNLTPQQERYLQTFCNGGQGTWCNMVRTIRLPDGTSATELKDSISDLITYHNSLALEFRSNNKGVEQRVNQNRNIVVNKILVKNVLCIKQQLKEVVLKASSNTINLFRDGFLFEIHLVQFSMESYLVWNVHHMISDGISQGFFEKALIQRLFCRNSYIDSVKNLPSYRSIAHEINMQVDRNGSDAGGYFSDLFSGFIDMHYKGEIGGRATTINKCLSRTFTMKAKTLSHLHSSAKHFSVSRFVILMAAYARLLSDLLGRSDIAIVTPFAGRDDKRWREVICNAINLVPLRVNTNFTKDVLVRTLNYQIIELQDKQSFQFNELLVALDRCQEIDRNPLTGFSINYMPVNSKLDVNHSNVVDKGYCLKYDLLLLVQDNQKSVNVEIQFRNSLFSPNHIAKLFDYLCVEIERITEEELQYEF